MLGGGSESSLLLDSPLLLRWRSARLSLASWVVRLGSGKMLSGVGRGSGEDTEDEWEKEAGGMSR